MKQYNIIYRTRNMLNGKIYIGAHSTNEIEDGYLGSGTAFKKALKKHGRKAFKREILFIFESSEEMWDKEKELVTAEFISDQNNYNCSVGGKGGFGGLPWNTGISLPDETKKKISESLKGQTQSSETIQKRINSRNGYSHSEETKAKIASANTGKPASPQAREAMKKAALARSVHGNTGKKNKIITCPYCKVSGGAGVMKRWHFDKCRSKVL